MARSTRLVILIKNIYTLWGRKRFLLPVTYFSTNLVYPFTLRVTGITNPSACYILSDESSIPFYSTSNGYKNGKPGARKRLYKGPIGLLAFEKENPQMRCNANHTQWGCPNNNDSGESIFDFILNSLHS